MSNSAGTARIGHGNGVGPYLGAEDMRQRVFEAERLSNAVDESNGARTGICIALQTTEKQPKLWRWMSERSEQR